MTRLIDVMHLGYDRVIGAYGIDGVVVDPGLACSLETVAEWRPSRLCLTHFGYMEGVPGQLDRVRAWLSHRGARARDLKTEQFAAELRAATYEAAAA